MKKKMATVLVLMLIVTSAICAQTVTYDVAVRSIVTQIVRAIDENEIIAIVGFDSTSEQFSTKLIDDVTRDLINDGIKVVERQRLDAVLREQNFQLSGNVSDESMQSIGRMLGASSIVIGNGENMTEHYRINFRVLSVRTALVKRQIAQDVTYNANMRRLLLTGNAASDSIGSTKVYVGGMLGLGIGLHSLNDEIVYVDDGIVNTLVPRPSPEEVSGLGFPLSLYVGYQILEHLAIQSGLDFLFNNNMKKDSSVWNTDRIVSYSSLDIPLLARYTIIFSPVILDVRGGFHISFPLGKINYEPSFDNTSSSEAAMMARIAMGVRESENLTPTNAAFGMNFGANIGYKFGLGNIIGGVSFVFDFYPIKADVSIRTRIGDNVWVWSKKEMDVITRRSLNIMIGYEYKL
jgi:hypothetical protein